MVVNFAQTIAALRPNVTSLGYALFLAINAASVWGGVFPFLPMSFQTPSVMLSFFVGQSLAFSLSFFAYAASAYHRPNTTRSPLVRLATIPYLVGWCCLIAAMYRGTVAIPLVLLGGGFLGVGSAGFYVLWQRLFASGSSDEGNRDLIVGTAYAALLYFALHLIPVALTAYLIPLVFLPLFCLAVVLRGRRIDHDQPMFEDVPRDHPHVYRRVVRNVWRSALAVGAIGFCAGTMRGLAIGEASLGSLVNGLSMSAMALASVILLTLWQLKNLRLNIIEAYRALFPFVISAFLLLPFLGMTYVRWLAAGSYAAFSVAIMLMMMQCAQISRDRGVSPTFVYGIMGGIVYVLHNIGFASGTFVTQLDFLGVPTSAMVALVSVYLLGLMYFVGQGGMRDALGRDGSENVELIALCPPRRIGHSTPDAPGRLEAAPHRARLLSMANESADMVFRDRTSKQVEIVRQRYRLSAREAEVLELIARGNSVASIAERLIVSENTIRTHFKRIYAKLDVHKKQELLDLVESSDPNEL